MDSYLSRRIKNWAAMQQPERVTRSRLLMMAAAGTSPQHLHSPPLSFRRLALHLLLTDKTPERNPFQTRYSRHTQLSILSLELIWRSSPLRYA